MFSAKTGLQLPTLQSSQMYYIPTNALGLARMDECLVPLFLFITYKFLYAFWLYLLAADTLRAQPGSCIAVKEVGSSKVHEIKTQFTEYSLEKALYLFPCAQLLLLPFTRSF